MAVANTGENFVPKLATSPLADIFRTLYRFWFRVELSGIQNVPNSGGAIIAANHGGVLPLDAAMLVTGLLDHHPAHRYVRMLVGNLVLRAPLMRRFAQKAGCVLANRSNAEMLLNAGHLIGVFPEGPKGVGKHYRNRYQLQPFGRGGLVKTSLSAQAPIIPCAILGSENTHPMLGNISFIARLLKIPYFPMTPFFPWLGPIDLIPLPVKWRIHFCSPIYPADRDAIDDTHFISRANEEVKATVQRQLDCMRRGQVNGRTATQIRRLDNTIRAEKKLKYHAPAREFSCRAKEILTVFEPTKLASDFA